jgi:hypothetical protein
VQDVDAEETIQFSDQGGADSAVITGELVGQRS